MRAFRVKSVRYEWPGPIQRNKHVQNKTKLPRAKRFAPLNTLCLYRLRLFAAPSSFANKRLYRYKHNSLGFLTVWTKGSWPYIKSRWSECDREEAMDGGGVEFDPIIPLVFVSFLQHQPCKNDQLARQLDVLVQDLKLPRRDINCNGLAEEDGELQTDGHHCCSTTDLVAGLEPMVALPEDPAMLRNLAAELINIADQMQHRVVSQAAQNLSRKLQNSPQQDWRKHLSAEVDSALKQVVGVGSGLEQLPHERVLLALTMTLVKGACERVPHLLKGLFSAALQYMSPVRSR